MNIEAEMEASLKNHSTFKIGGYASLAVFPKNKDELRTSVGILNGFGIRYRVFGRGSNILFSDDGYDGALIFTNKMCGVEVMGREVHAECGATLKSVANFALKHSLTGLEFAHGIPGSTGGGVYMNAGAYGGEISDVLIYSEYFDTETGEFGRMDYKSHGFSYRHSAYVDKRNLIVVSVCFVLRSGDADQIKATMDGYAARRKSSQPLEYPSAGSTFKRPQNAFAAKLIDDSGLKGLTVGGAQVSEKHAGFIINRGGATASDVLALMQNVKEKVARDYGIVLESEIEYVE